MSEHPANGTVHAVLLQQRGGKYAWGVVHVRDGVNELIDINLPNLDAAKSAAWAFAQAHNATFVPSRRAR